MGSVTQRKLAIRWTFSAYSSTLALDAARQNTIDALVGTSARHIALASRVCAGTTSDAMRHDRQGAAYLGKPRTVLPNIGSERRGFREVEML